MRFALLLLWLTTLAPAAHAADWLTWRRVGEATLTWGPFTVYHSQLRTPNGRYDGPQQDRALIITYQRDIDREALVEATRDQWQAQGILQQEPRSEAPAAHAAGDLAGRRAGQPAGVRGQRQRGTVLVPRQRRADRLYPARPAPVGGIQHPLSRHLARSAHHLSRTASAVDRRYTMKRILTLGLGAADADPRRLQHRGHGVPAAAARPRHFPLFSGPNRGVGGWCRIAAASSCAASM